MVTIIKRDIWYDPRLRRIAQLQMEISRAIINGHKATEDDKFSDSRKEINLLRNQLKIGIIKP